MPRRLLGIFMLLLASSSFVWAQGDVVLLTVGSEQVTQREFEYHLCNSHEKRADVFVETYARFKQKVQRAKELGLDTLASYRKQKDTYGRLMREKNVSVKSRGLERCGEKEWVQLLHITYPLMQSACKKELIEGRRYMDSLYAKLKDDAEVRQMELLPWKQSRHLLNEWQAQLENLAKGEISKPFVSPMGIHLIAWKEKRMVKPSESVSLHVDEALEVKKMEEALLVVALDSYLENQLVCTEEELQKHFKKHRSDYGFGIPHFKGAVIHCHHKKEAKAIRNYLKKYPEELWKAAIERMPEEVSEGCRIETGLFAIGANQYVDKLVFKCGSFEPLADYPHTWVLGKKLKKGPEDFKIIKSKVENDCLEIKKKSEIEALTQKYRIEIDKEVLKTVNRAENK